VGFGRTYGCRCGILYAPMLGVVYYAGLVSMTSSSYPSPCAPYSSELIGLGILYITLLAENCQILNMAATGRNISFFLVNKHHHLAIFIVVFSD